MAQRSRFYDAVGGDRVYDSSAFAQVIAAQIGDGVVYGSGGGLELAVIENSPPSMTVRVQNGIAFIQGYYHEVYSGPDVLTIAAANATNPRIDRVVVRRDLTARTGSIAVLTGTPAASPVAPALTQNAAGVWEVPLAQVRVNASVASIVNANITDERGSRAKGTDLGSLVDPTTGHKHTGAAGDGATVAYASISGKPTGFAPTAHAHADASSGGTVAYGVLTGVPSSFTPTAHNHDVAGSYVAYANLTGKPTSMAPTAHAIDPASGFHTGTLPWGSVSGKPATFAPADHGATHIWGGGDGITGMPQLKAQGGGSAGHVIWTGTTDPGANAVEGDIWIKG